VADQIRFTGATIRAKRYELAADEDGFAWPLLIVPAAVLAISISLVRKL
jgi:hypothetical protein